MVRVLLFDVFKESKVIGTKEEPICSCSVGPLLLFATRTRILFHYSPLRFGAHEADEAPTPRLVGSLKTIGSVVKLKYLANVDVLLTLEREDPYSSQEGQVCRVYCNWRIACGAAPSIFSPSSSPAPLFPSSPSPSPSSSEEDPEPIDSTEVTSLETALNAPDTDPVVSAFTIPLREDARDVVICTTGKKFGIVTESDIHVCQLQRFPPPPPGESSSEGGGKSEEQKKKDPITRRELVERRKKKEKEERKRARQSLVCMYCIQTTQLPFERVAISDNYVAFVLCENEQASPFVVVLDIAVQIHSAPNPIPRSSIPSPSSSSSSSFSSSDSDYLPRKPATPSRPPHSSLPRAPSSSSSHPSSRLQFELTPYFKMRDFLELDRILPADNPMDMANRSSSSSFFDKEEPEVECLFGDNGMLLCPTIPTIALVEEGENDNPLSPRDTGGANRDSLTLDTPLPEEDLGGGGGGGGGGGEDFVLIGGSSQRGYLVWSNDAFGYHVVSVKEILREECELNFGAKALLLLQFLPEYSAPAPPFVVKGKGDEEEGDGGNGECALWARTGMKQSGTCFIYTNSRDGKIFDLETKKQVAQYQFSEEISGVLTDGVFLYTYNSSKLEVYTMRSSLSPKEAKDCPDIALIGMSPLMSLANVLIHNHTLIVTSKESALKSTSPRPVTEPHMLPSSRSASSSSFSSGPSSGSFSSGSSSSGSSSSSSSSPRGAPEGRTRRGFGLFKRMFSKTAAVEEPAQTVATSPSPQPVKPEQSLSWTSYMICPLPLDDLTDQMNAYASNFQESSPATYYHLILENRFLAFALRNRLCHRVAHLALTSSSLKGKRGRRRGKGGMGGGEEGMVLGGVGGEVGWGVKETFEKYNLSLAKSGEKLAHYHFDSEDYMASSLLFGKSSAPFEGVLEKLLGVMQTMEVVGGGGGKAFLTYLEEMVFGCSGVSGEVSTSEKIGNQILGKLVTLAPQKVAPVVMESKLKDFSLDFVLKLLCDLQSQLDTGGRGAGKGKKGEEAVFEGGEVFLERSRLGSSSSLMTVVKQKTYMSPKNLYLKTLLLLRTNQPKKAANDLSLFEPAALIHLILSCPLFLFSTDILDYKQNYSKYCRSSPSPSPSPSAPSSTSLSFFSSSTFPSFTSSSSLPSVSFSVKSGNREVCKVLGEKVMSSDGTDLAGLMLIYAPWLLFEVVLSLVSNKQISILTALSSLDVKRVSFTEIPSTFRPHYSVLMESFIEEVLLDTSIVLSDDEFEHLLSSLVGLYFSHWSGEGEGRYPKFVVKEMLDREPEPGEAIEILSHQNTEERLNNHFRRFSENFPEWVSTILQKACERGESLYGSVRGEEGESSLSSSSPSTFSLATLSTNYFYPLKLLGLFSSLDVLSRTKTILASPSSTPSLNIQTLLKKVLDSKWILHQLAALSLLNIREEAVSYLLSSFPSALLPYCEFWVSDEQEWKGVIKTLIERMGRGKGEEGEEGRGIEKALDQVLHYLAHNVEVQRFMELIPEEGSVMYFLPYLEMAMHKKHAILLKDQLLKKAESSLMKEMEENGLV